MARKVKSAELDSKQARERLKPRGKPYWRSIEQGLHLGYRRLRGKAGTWWARHYIGNQDYEIEAVGIADDISDADGIEILSYWQAQEKARDRRKHRAQAKAGLSDLTVADAVETYIEIRDERESKRRGLPVRSDASQRLCRYVIGQEARGQRDAIPAAPLAAIELQKLEDDDLKKWRGKLPKELKDASKQRLINDLKAALNEAYKQNRKRLPVTLPDVIKVSLAAQESDDDSIAAPDNQILTDGQVTKLLRAALEVDAERERDGDLFRLIIVLAATGARFSQVSRLRVADCQIENSRLLMPVSRKGNTKNKNPTTTVPIGKDVVEALRPAVTGRKPNDWLLERWQHVQVKGGKWERSTRDRWLTNSEWNREWDAIRERAKLPDATPYAFRHSSIVRGLRSGLPTRLVAALHETSVQMLERHYSRWIAEGLEELAAKAIVPLMPKLDKGQVISMTAGR